VNCGKQSKESNANSYVSRANHVEITRKIREAFIPACRFRLPSGAIE
jgi:hypothetical protein